MVSHKVLVVFVLAFSTINLCDAFLGKLGKAVSQVVPDDKDEGTDDGNSDNNHDDKTESDDDDDSNKKLEEPIQNVLPGKALTDDLQDTKDELPKPTLKESLKKTLDEKPKEHLKKTLDAKPQEPIKKILDVKPEETLKKVSDAKPQETLKETVPKDALQIDPSILKSSKNSKESTIIFDKIKKSISGENLPKDTLFTTLLNKILEIIMRHAV